MTHYFIYLLVQAVDKSTRALSAEIVNHVDDSGNLSDSNARAMNEDDILSYIDSHVSKHFNFRPIDNMDFFRCLVILLCYSEKYIIVQNGTPKYYTNRKDFAQNFYKLISSQSLPIGRYAIIDKIQTAKQSLVKNGFGENVSAIAGTRILRQLNKADLLTEVEKIEGLLKNAGKSRTLENLKLF